MYIYYIMNLKLWFSRIYNKIHFFFNKNKKEYKKYQQENKDDIYDPSKSIIDDYQSYEDHLYKKRYVLDFN